MKTSNVQKVSPLRLRIGAIATGRRRVIFMMESMLISRLSPPMKAGDLTSRRKKEYIENTISGPRYSYLGFPALRYDYGNLEMTSGRANREFQDLVYATLIEQMDPWGLQKCVCRDLGARTGGGEDCPSRNCTENVRLEIDLAAIQQSQSLADVSDRGGGSVEEVRRAAEEITRIHENGIAEDKIEI